MSALGPCRWQLPDPAEAPPGDELLAVGADLAPETMISAYRSGLFPMGVSEKVMGWWSPDPRGILRPLDFHRSKSLKKSTKRFTVTFDHAFSEVVRSCADPQRPHGWIDQEFVEAYQRLHQLGYAHSVEVWLQLEPRNSQLVTDSTGRRKLVGGLFGVEVGGLFAAESMFHSATDASKVAVGALAELLAAVPPASQRLIDVQWYTEHLATLGAIQIARPTYLNSLAAAVQFPPAFPGRQLGVVRG